MTQSQCRFDTVLLNGPHARSNVRTAVNRLLERCLM